MSKVRNIYQYIQLFAYTFGKDKKEYKSGEVGTLPLMMGR